MLNKQLLKTVRFKVLAALTLVFVLAMVSTIFAVYKSEKDMAENLAKQRVDTMTYFYIDMLNLMMINDEMEERDLVKGKVLAQEGVIDIRMVRHPIMNTMNEGEFAPGPDDQQPKDELEQRAIDGEEIEVITEGPDGRVLTVINPFYALEDYRGTDCLGCHEVPENTLVGVVRIDYSLNQLDSYIVSNILKSATAQVILSAIGLLILVYVMNTLVNRPLVYLSKTIRKIGENSDLTTRLQFETEDEFSRVASAFNGMQDSFQASMQKVSKTVVDLNAAVNEISEQSTQTASAINEQSLATDQVATAIAEMEQSATEVKNNATTTAEASEETNGLSVTGVKDAERSIMAITSLSDEIENTATVITELNEKTNMVGAVLDVIKSIADQTNLLALNAAIEAARAGEHGRGFAVVADEVRSLSAKTHQSTQEIQAVIESLQQQAHSAVAAVGPAKETAAQGIKQAQQAVDSLRLIAEHVSGINDLNNQMAIAADEQSRVTEDINNNIVNIKSIGEQTSARAAQSKNCSESLLRLADELDDMVHKFKTE